MNIAYEWELFGKRKEEKNLNGNTYASQSVCGQY